MRFAIFLNYEASVFSLYERFYFIILLLENQCKNNHSLFHQGHFVSKAVKISFVWSHPAFVCVKYYRMDTQIKSTTYCLFRASENVDGFIFYLTYLL